MQIDRRYADYGLTGGFFLICQLGLLWALGYWPRVTPAQLKALLPSETPLLAPIITGFAGALAVIAVFVVGLILDLLASLWRGMEMKIFARHLDHNSEWMTAFIEAHKAYCGYDYETFQRAFHDPPSRGKRAAAMFTLWKRESRLRLEAGLKVEWGLGIASQYELLHILHHWPVWIGAADLDGRSIFALANGTGNRDRSVLTHLRTHLRSLVLIHLHIRLAH